MVTKREKMRKVEKVRLIIEELKKLYPNAVCGLTYDETPYKLVIATILSAQTTDKSVNKITPELWKKYPSIELLAQAKRSDIEIILKSIGLFRNKSKFIISAAEYISLHGIPDSIKELTEIPGVGRKTANVVLGEIFKQPAITTDTHVIRLSNRLGLVKEKNPKKIEMILKKIIPEIEQTLFSHRIITHGRTVCFARKPACSICSLQTVCLYKKTEAR